MKRKRVLAGFMIAIMICIVAVAVIIVKRSIDDKYIKTANEDDISRYEWMEMLCEQSGLTEYQSEEPYYEDVNTSNTYFSYIQSAVEWDVLESDKKFEGDGYASGRFVLITAMKSLGERKLKLYLDTEESITDTVYIQTALEHNLLMKEELSQGISRESAERVLEQIANLKYTEFWVDDYEKVEYRDGVVEIDSQDILEKNEDGSEITVSETVLSDISAGTIIVYPPDSSGMKAAKRVSSVDEWGNITLADDVEQDEVLETLIVSDIVEVTVQDIFNYYGLQEEYSAGSMAYSQFYPETMMPVWYGSGEWEDKGFKIAVSVEEGEKGKKNYLEIKITDNNTGTSMTLPIKQEVSWVSGCQAELDVNKIYAAGHVEMDIWGLEYAEAALNVQSTFTGGIKTEESKESARVKLFEMPAPLGSGLCGINIQVYLMVSVEGEIFLKAELPVDFCVKYDKKSGIRNEKVKQGEKKTELKLNCEADFALRIEPILLCLYQDAMDMELDIGIAVETEVNMRPSDMVCMDLTAAFPVLKISVSDDDKIDTFVGDTLGISAEWEVITAETAPFRRNIHVEKENDTRKIVDECTYNKSEKTDTTKKTDTSRKTDISANTYYTRYGEVNQIDSPVFCFDYPDNWHVSIEEVNATPDEFEIFGDYVQEVVELMNKRGVTVTFIKIDDEIFELAGRGHLYAEYSAEKVADTSFRIAKGNTSADFVIVKLTRIDEMISGVGSVDSDASVSYAIMQGNIVDESEGSLLASGPLGFYEMISFYYPMPYAFYAKSPDGQFTEEEEKEVIEILQSFREDGFYIRN